MTAGLGGDTASEAPRLVHRKVELMPPRRYAPLVIVVVLTIVTALIGTVLTLRGATSSGLGGGDATIAPPPLEFIEGPGEVVSADACRPALPGVEIEPWTAATASESEAIWTANSASLTNAYVEGESGFVFWGDIQNNNFSQALGRRSLTASEIEVWTTSLRAVKDELAADGIEFFVLIGPAKWDIYPEQIPRWAQEIDGSGPLEQLLRAAPDLPIIDVRADLRRAAEDDLVYSTVNSHWSDYGAWVGWKAATRCITASEPSYAGVSVPEIDGVATIEGGNEFAQWGFAPAQPDWTIPVLSEPLAPVTVAIDGRAEETRGDEQRIGLEEMPSTVTNQSAQRPETLLLVRDSMATSLTPWAQQSFATVRQIRHAFDFGDPEGYADIPAEAKSSGADIVILQFAQRHLNLPPVLD